MECAWGSAAEKKFRASSYLPGNRQHSLRPTLPTDNSRDLWRRFPAESQAHLAAEQLKSAMAGDPSIRINEIRSLRKTGGGRNKSCGAADRSKVLGAQEINSEILRTRKNLLQLILGAESNRGGPGGGGGGLGFGPAVAEGGGNGASWRCGTGGAGSYGRRQTGHCKGSARRRTSAGNGAGGPGGGSGDGSGVGGRVAETVVAFWCGSAAEPALVVVDRRGLVAE